MSDSDIAIVGIAAHLPGAATPRQYWDNLRTGVESVRHFTDEELLAAGLPSSTLLRPGYVKAGATLDGLAEFDAEFFGFSPKDAAIMDPQHRHFLEAAWEAMEDAGHVPMSFDGAIGVFAGCGTNSYFMFNLLTNPELVDDVGLFLLRHTGNDKDFLATRASYLLDLRGPSVNVQTACSTSLVATHLAVQHLLSGECDLALAGGVTIEIPHARGYQYHEGEVLSPDGHCHAFDHRSKGTVFGSGVGVVALRRLEDAIADHDQIYAVIKGTAVNNDGSQKVGYLAPSVDGQAACIAEAIAVADVGADTLSYVECHGTGTPMGDPIEIAALTQAFGLSSDHAGECAIGSVKTNIGHLDTAAGVASLIKVALSLRHGEIPPSLNFERNNPNIDFERSPFRVNAELASWNSVDGPRRAGVNSLGVGGTNAFAVLEEAPVRTSAPAEQTWRPIVLSGRNKRALDENASNLADHLRRNPEIDLADVAWTLQVGRHHFSERRVIVARTNEEAIELLEGSDHRRVFTHSSGPVPEVVFMFPGGGTQYARMASGLVDAHPVFAEHLDHGIRLLQDRHGIDLRPLLFCDKAEVAQATTALERPSLQLPAIFVVEHALAQLLLSRGIRPTAMIGHSLGESTAACLSGTMTFEQCLGLVVLRGALVERVSGGTVSVALTAEELSPLLAEFELDLAVENAPDICVVSGPVDKLDPFEERLRAQGAEPQRLKLSTAAHSRILDPLLPEFRAYLATMDLSKPTIPWVSNRTGTWITADEATDPDYWVSQLRHTARFSSCVETVLAEPGVAMLEVGPGKVLSSIVRMNPAFKATHATIPTLRHADEQIDDVATLLAAEARIWAAGGELATERWFAGEQRARVALPTYAFQRHSYFIEPGAGASSTEADDLLPRVDESDWFWEPVWRHRDLEETTTAPAAWLVFCDQVDLVEPVIEQIRAKAASVVVVRSGDSFQRVSDDEYVIAAENGRLDYDMLVRELVRSGRIPDRIAHLALLADDEQHFRPGSSFFHRNQELGFKSLVFLAQAWSSEGISRPLHIAVATIRAQRVLSTDSMAWFEQSTVLGPARVIPHEFAGVTVSAIDVDPSWFGTSGRWASLSGRLTAGLERVRTNGSAPDGTRTTSTPVERLADELCAPPSNDVVALRDTRRFVQDVRPRATPAGDTSTVREGGVVLITGGQGGIGLTIAEHLHTTKRCRLALLSRTPMPDRTLWSELADRLGRDHPTAERIRRIQALEDAGAEVLLLAGDVTDVERMRTVVGEVRRRFGPVNAVVHAAGVVADQPIAVKDERDMEEVLAPKVYGTIVLDEVLKDHEVELFAVFSSTSTVTAPIGQTDYVAANSFLNAFAQRGAARPDTTVVAVNWGIWQDVGMAAAAMQTASDGDDVAVSAECAHPFFTTRTTDGRGVTRLLSTWRADREWYLDDHRNGAGDALFPGAGYVELARAALAELGLDRPFEIRDLTFLRPLACAEQRDCEIRTVLVPNEEGYRMEVQERVAVGEHSFEDGPTTGRLGWRTTAQGALLLYEQPDANVVDLAAVDARCQHRGTHGRQDEHLNFGPRWQTNDAVRVGHGEAIARLGLPPRFSSDLAEYRVHPALLDRATGFAMELIEGYSGDHLWVPISYDSITVLGPLSEEVVAVATARSGSSESAGFATFDVTVCDPNGVASVVVKGFAIKQLDGVLDAGLGRAVLATDVEFDTPPHADRPFSRAEMVLRQNLGQGITSEEGGRAFDRAIAAGPVVYVSSMNLADLRTQSAAVASASVETSTRDAAATFARPTLDSEYLEPRNDIERSLAELWQELLGVNQIGVCDDFFELGGHSLVAVRMFARIKKMFAVEFPISVLFEAPTIESCAALISAAMPGTESDSSDTSVSVVAPHPRYMHLVAMHPGEGGDRSPFFLVAGMFGNVLNLRHLAHLVGTDRPFYGVQARGLYGGGEPHGDFVEMARDYLREVRMVQPHGPYFLGGFSGGGIAAFEMAQQLRADGEEVALLVFLDTATSFNPPLLVKDRVQIQLDNLRADGPTYLKDWAVNRVRWEREKRRRSNGAEQEQSADGSLHSREIEAAFYRALDLYETKPYDGDIVLYRPALSPLHVFGPDRQVNVHRRFIYHDNGWGPFCRRIDVTEVPGGHDEMVLEPYVRVLAGHLRAALDEAELRSVGADEEWRIEPALEDSGVLSS